MAIYHFNGITLDTEARQIERADGSLHLPPKPFQVLMELLREPGRLVTREELLARVWPERPASDEVLSRTVADLRKHLGDDPRSHRYIETLPKVGYRFAAAVELAGETLRKRRIRWRVAVPAFAVAAVAVLVLALYATRQESAEAPAVGMLSPPMPLTTELGDEDVPDFSPDGRMLVYASRSRGDEDWGIRLTDLHTGESRDLVVGPDREYAPVFAPDGSRVAYLRYRGERCMLMVMELDGPAREVASCRTPLMAYVDWSADGREIAFTDYDESASNLILKLVDVEDRTVRRLLSASDPGTYEFAPHFSPDGRTIAFVKGDLYRNEIWLADLESGLSRQLTRLNMRLTGMAWNGDGSVLFFTTARPDHGIWRITPGDDPVRLETFEAVTPAYDAVNQRLVVDQIRPRTNIWSVSIDEQGFAGQPARELASTRIDNSPSVSPDGARLVFVSNRTGESEVWAANPGTSGPRRLTEWNAAEISRPDWSPDGSAVVYSVLTKGAWIGYLHPMDGGNPRSLFTDGRDVVNPVWSGDGRSILYGDGAGIRRVDPTTSMDEPLLELRGAIPLFEHEGRPYYLRPDRSGIERLESDGLSSTLLGEFDLVVPAAISRAGSSLFFIANAPGDGVRRMFRYGMESGELSPLLEVVAFARQAHVAAAPGGRRLFYSQTDDVESDLVMIENVR